jgi:predicted phosphodiesterase
MGKTLILSDIHFCKRGSTVKSVEQLRPLWQGFDSLILNGDTSELHSASHAEASKQAAADVKVATKRDGVKITFICGNHDPTISDIEHIWFHNTKTLVFHGHAPIEGVAPWSWRCKYIAENNESQIKETGDGFEEQLNATRTASTFAATGAFKQHRPAAPHMLMLSVPAVYKVIRCWWQYPSTVANWIHLYAPSAKFVITGHTHHAGIWKRQGITVINTGCFGFPSHPRAVVIDSTTITVHKLTKKNGVYELGRVCESWSAL